MLENNLARGLAFGALGYVIGLSTGVAALGSAVSGAFVFGPIGFVIGWLLPWRKGYDGPPTTRADVAGVSSLEAGPTPPHKASDLQEAEQAITGMLPLAGRALAAVWNMQMRLLIMVGLMPLLQRYPWAMLGIAVLLLAFVFPLGIIFTVTGLVAMHFNAAPKSQFLVVLRPSAPE